MYTYTFVDTLKIIKQNRQKKTNSLHFLFAIFIIAGSIKLTLHYRPLLTFDVPTNSMSDTIIKNDYILVKHINEIKRGEVVVFLYQKDMLYTKRCIATGDDTIFMENGDIFIHPQEGNQYIQENFLNHDRKIIDNNIYVKNPYVKTNSNILEKSIIDEYKKHIILNFDPIVLNQIIATC